jgi:hypothetical protein
MTQTQPSPMPPAPGAPKSSGNALNIILAVLGGLVVLTLLIGSARSAFAALNRDQSTHSASVQGVTGLEISAGAGNFDLRFADVSEATLDVDSTKSQDWKLMREGSNLVVDSPNGWGNWCFFGCGNFENAAVLTLPESMNDGSLDALFDLAAGDFNAVGSFRNLDIEVGAGELELPDATYDVRQDVAAGDISNLLATDKDSPNKISVEVSAGNASFYPQDSGPGPWED